VCELLPNVWLAEDKALMPNAPLMGKADVWGAMVNPNQYLEDKVKELIASEPAWKDRFAENKGYPKYHRATKTLEIRTGDERDGDTVG